MKELTNYLYETGQLKRVKRSGWWLINIQDPESVAEHSQRTALIGYFLAKLEKVDAGKVLVMCLFHDTPETRVNDMHKVGQKYIEFKAGEDAALKDQLESIGELGSELLNNMQEYQARQTPEAEVARDADLLENALTAFEYIKIGYKDAQNWADNIEKILKTESAKKLFQEIKNTDPNDWWRNLKKIER